MRRLASFCLSSQSLLGRGSARNAMMIPGVSIYPDLPEELQSLKDYRKRRGTKRPPGEQFARTAPSCAAKSLPSRPPQRARARAPSPSFSKFSERSLLSRYSAFRAARRRVPAPARPTPPCPIRNPHIPHTRCAHKHCPVGCGCLRLKKALARPRCSPSARGAFSLLRRRAVVGRWTHITQQQPPSAQQEWVG
jgi:hypothetical protein